MLPQETKRRQAVNKSREKQRHLDYQNTEELISLRDEYKKLCAQHGKKEPEVYKIKPYPAEIQVKVHDERPHKRHKAPNDAVRQEREREVNRSATWRRDQRIKHDRKERLREIAFLKKEIHLLK